jgi:hypothetical protein
LALSDSFGLQGARWLDGDFTGDGAVSFEDFLVLRPTWQTRLMCGNDKERI